MFRLIEVVSGGHFFNQLCRIDMVGFHEILEGYAVISQLRVEQADEKMGVHGGEMIEVHVGNLPSSFVADKRGSCGVGEKNLI